MSPLEIAAKLACIDIYPPITPSVFDNQYHIGDVVCGTTIINNTFYISNQGTINLAGWKSDFDIMPVFHPVLGILHNGFYKNLPQLVSCLLKSIPLGMSVICCGHSKGAANSAILAALLKLAGINVVHVYLFACPNAGYSQYSKWMRDNIQGISYRNASSHLPWCADPVPEVPLSPFVPAYPHTEFTEYPSGFSWLLPSNWHSAQLYYDGIKKAIS